MGYNVGPTSSYNILLASAAHKRNLDRRGVRNERDLRLDRGLVVALTVHVRIAVYRSHSSVCLLLSRRVVDLNKVDCGAPTKKHARNIFRLMGDMSHLAAIVLLPFKLHMSRSAAGARKIIVPEYASLFVCVPRFGARSIIWCAEYFACG